MSIRCPETIIQSRVDDALGEYGLANDDGRQVGRLISQAAAERPSAAPIEWHRRALSDGSLEPCDRVFHPMQLASGVARDMIMAYTYGVEDYQ